MYLACSIRDCVVVYALCCRHCVSHAPPTCSYPTADGVSPLDHGGGPVPRPGDGPGRLLGESIGESPHAIAIMKESTTAGIAAMTTMKAAGGTERGAAVHLHKGSAHVEDGRI